MQPGEVVVARLAKAASVVRYLGGSEANVSVALGRNRQARIPSDRILLATGLVLSRDEEVESFRQECQALGSDIELSEVWETVGDEAAPMSLDSLAELYWGATLSPAQRVALALHLEQSSEYFVRENDRYHARTRASVEEIQTRRRREAQRATVAQALMDQISLGRLPQPLDSDQAALLQRLRDYAVHGEEHVGSRVARSLLEKVAGGTRDLQRLCFDLLVGAGVFSPDEPLELHRAGIVKDFPKNVIAEAAAIDLERLMAELPREDLVALPAVTIDDIEAKERDDALSLEVQAPGPGTAGPRYRMGIHIADAGALIAQGGALDREADLRMATLYLPEFKIGMLPPDFTHRLGSLDPGETRFAMSLLAQISASGDILSWEVTPSLVRSKAALTYDEADRALEDEGSPWHRMLNDLSQVTQALSSRREDAGAINLDQPEMSISVEPSGEVKVRVLQRSSPARLLVTELMVLCNTLLAEFCRKEQLPAVYRAQVAPDLAGLAVATQDGAGVPHERATNEAEATLRRYLIMKRLTPAEMDLIPAPHGGLGVAAYIQATSPLRRYPDLVMQRQIGHYLSAGKPFYPPETVASVLQRAEVQLREMARLEEERKRYWFLKYLQQSRLGAAGSAERSDLFTATVLENEPRRRGLLELTEFPFRVRAELPRTRNPGTTVTLRLQGVDLWRRIGYFVHVETAPR